MNSKTMIVNAIVASLYVAITLLIQPIAFLALQFRISEVFNHLIVFDKKYFFGIVIGVFISNLFSPIHLDIIFGVMHSIISLLITIIIIRFIKNIWIRMLINTSVFTFMMFIIAFELHLTLKVPIFETWLWTSIGELTVMIFGMPIMYYINERINLKNIFRF